MIPRYIFLIIASWVICGLLLPAKADTAEDFAADAVGIWINADQSSLPDYDFILSELTRLDMPDAEGVWLLQQNWILGPQALDGKVRREGKSPYFQIAIQLRDFADGSLNTSTYRLTSDGKAASLRIMPGSVASFEREWLGPLVCMGRVQKLAHGFWEGTANCPNTYKGSVRVDSRLLRAPDTWVNWDRGFDANGKHIWGPASGGYIFKRSSSVP